MTESEVQRHVVGCQAGARASQKWVFERYYRKMFGVCLRYIPDHDEVQDVLQEGFLKVFGSINGYTSKGSFEGWMRRIMVNTAVDHLRKKKSMGWLLRQDSIEESGAVDEAHEPEESDISDDFSVEDVYEAMASLTPMYRTVFNLYVFEQLGHQEIADQLGIQLGTSKSNLAKARRNVKQFLLAKSKAPSIMKEKK
jgi:RNA polymerase sigma factor (sigma-70 family)